MGTPGRLAAEQVIMESKRWIEFSVFFFCDDIKFIFEFTVQEVSAKVCTSVCVAVSGEKYNDAAV
jgi:hypothetical protein